jgi:Domain of unknown function (DUF4440)
MRALEERMTEFQRVIEDRDVAGAREVLDEDYALCIVHPTSLTVPRNEWLAALPNYVVHEWTEQERHVDLDGDCAAVLHRGFQRAKVNGAARDGLFVVSDVWRRRDGLWRVWRRHSSPMSAGEMPTR